MRSGVRTPQHGRRAIHIAKAFVSCALALASFAAAAEAAPRPPRAVEASAPALRIAGGGRLTWWGFAAYDARLWLAPEATQRTWTQHPLALELAYLRAFTGKDISRVSLEQMQRAGGIDAGIAQRWTDELLAAIPDVAPGDRLLGVHRPGRGASFYFNGKFAGEIADAEFSRRFFSIWLAPSTSEPGLRAALLGSTPP
nr:chalcone isomerase family protein [Caenimonas aquaedulcis]